MARTITSPVPLIHGDDDRVTPLRHTRFLANQMGRRGNLLVLKGEAHTIRRPTNIAHALRAELTHYLDAMGLAVPATQRQ